MKTIELNKWDRYETFKHYDVCTNPFIIITVKVDITNLYKYAKQKGLSLYASLGHEIVKTANMFEEFKYRKNGDEIILYDDIIPNFTENKDGKDVYYFDVDYCDSLEEFSNRFRKIREESKDAEIEINLNRIWMSCTPWYYFNSLVPPFNRDNTIPQFIWSKFIEEDNKIMTNLMVMVHHGFIDGYKLGLFYEKLEENIKNIKGDE